MLTELVKLWREWEKQLVPDDAPQPEAMYLSFAEFVDWLEAQEQSGQKMCDLLYCCHGSKPAGHAQPTETDGSSDKTLNPHKTSERVRLVPAEPAQPVSEK